MSTSLAREILEDLQQARSEDQVAATVREVRVATPTGPAVVIPHGSNDGRVDLLSTLQSRRSTRFFADTMVEPGSLVDIVRDGIVADRSEWGGSGWTFEVSVVAFRVAGVDEAIYRLDPVDGLLTPIAKVPSGEERYDLTIQREFCDAAAIISVAANLGEIAETSGSHGYRMAMTRAGAATYTMWLSAVSRGLTGTVFAGFIPASVRQPLHSDGASRHQLFAIALGVPVSNPRT